jgi:hypothetical protein
MGKAIENLTKLASLSKKIPFKYRSLVTMNDKKPITLDVIVVYDNSLFSVLNNLTSQQYFNTRNQLYRDNQHLMSISTWDVMGGKVSPNYQLHIGKNPVCIMIFASYENQDHNHKLIIPPTSTEIMILLNEKTIITPNNGLDYINTGQNKEFLVLETIKKPTNKFTSPIPSGYNVFYSLDDNYNIPSVIDDPNLLYQNTVVKTSNEPLRLDTLMALDDDIQIQDKEFFAPSYGSWGQLLRKKLNKFLFNKQGIIDNTVLKAHGFVILYDYEVNKKNFHLLLGVFKNKKYLYMARLKEFFINISYGRHSSLEEKTIKSFGNSQANRQNGGSYNNINQNKNFGPGGPSSSDGNNGKGTNGSNNPNNGSQSNNGSADGKSSSNNDNNTNNNNGNGQGNNNQNQGEGGKNSDNPSSDDKKDANGNNPQLNGDLNGKNGTTDGNDQTKDGSPSEGENSPSKEDGKDENEKLPSEEKQDNGEKNKENQDEEDKKNNSSSEESSNDGGVPDKELPSIPSLANLNGLSANLSAKSKWLNLFKAVQNGVSQAKQAINYVI